MREFYTLKKIEEKYGIKDATMRSYISRGQIFPQSVINKVGTVTTIDRQFIDVFYGGEDDIRYKYEDCIREKLSPAPKSLSEWFYLLGIFSLAADKKLFPNQSISLENTSAQKWLNGKYVKPQELANMFTKQVWLKYGMDVDLYLSRLLSNWVIFPIENSDKVEDRVEVETYFGPYLAGWTTASTELKDLLKEKVKDEE